MSPVTCVSACSAAIACDAGSAAATLAASEDCRKRRLSMITPLFLLWLKSSRIRRQNPPIQRGYAALQPSGKPFDKLATSVSLSPPYESPDKEQAA
jgi:hypothetical protein